MISRDLWNGWAITKWSSPFVFQFVTILSRVKVYLTRHGDFQDSATPSTLSQPWNGEENKTWHCKRKGVVHGFPYLYASEHAWSQPLNSIMSPEEQGQVLEVRARNDTPSRSRLRWQGQYRACKKRWVWIPEWVDGSKNSAAQLAVFTRPTIQYQHCQGSTGESADPLHRGHPI